MKAADAAITASQSLIMKTDVRHMTLNGTRRACKYDYEIAAEHRRDHQPPHEEKNRWEQTSLGNVTVSEADAKKTALDRVSGATDEAKSLRMEA
ncbi:MAG: hypothetical protein ACLU48_07850 [Clostridiaceae bacterium]